MTAKAEWQRSSGGGVLLILGAVLLGLMWISAMGAGVEAYTVSPHVQESHGMAATNAVTYLQTGGPYRKEPCAEENKFLLTFRFNGGQWAAIVKGGRVVTAFPTTREYLNSVRDRDDCGNGLRWGTHDLPSMAQ